jgi:hypothetical protein
VKSTPHAGQCCEAICRSRVICTVILWNRIPKFQRRLTRAQALKLDGPSAVQAVRGYPGIQIACASTNSTPEGRSSGSDSFVKNAKPL